MKTTVQGIQLNYEISGQADAPPVVLSHCLASSMVMWQPQLPALEAAFRVIRYDLRGHGRSDAPEGPYRLEMLAGDVVGLLDVLEIDRVHFAGLSIGGMIGQALGVHHQDRLLSLALCDTAPRTPEEARPVLQKRIDAARKHGLASQVEETMARWFSPEFRQSGHPEVELIRQQVLKTPVAGYTGCLEAIKQLDYLERLAGITVPTLVIVGENDPGAPVAAAEAMQARIPGSKLVVIPEALHLSNIEQAENFNQALLSFLKACDSGSGQ